jgi:hypothetical protein
MITITATARCGCGWSAGPGDWATVDKAAEAHTRKAGHATITEARPAGRIMPDASITTGEAGR